MKRLNQRESVKTFEFDEELFEPGDFLKIDHRLCDSKGSFFVLCLSESSLREIVSKVTK